LSPGVLKAAKYKINWEMKTLQQLKPLYDKVMVFLQKTEHGEYLAFRELFGEEVAIRVAMKGEMKLPAFVTNAQKSALQEPDSD
jgi:hypothetical protein